MSDTDVLKMKVADLKRELKVRGLSVTGNKTELQERLQNALIDGDLTLEDTAISEHEDLLDEEDVLTDEEAESAALESPINENNPSSIFLSSTPPTSSNTDEIDLKIDETPKPKKVILKRKNSLSKTPLVATVTPTVVVVDDNSRKTISPPSEKFPKIEYNTNSVSKIEETNGNTVINDNKTLKVTQLTLQERMDMRAKKFGKLDSGAPVSSTVAINSKIDNKLEEITTSNDPKVIEALKKRALRFGCTVSPQIVKIENAEKLQKRKERFGGGAANSGDTTIQNAVSEISTVYAEKAKLRLERFQATAK